MRHISGLPPRPAYGAELQGYGLWLKMRFFGARRLAPFHLQNHPFPVNTPIAKPPASKNVRKPRPTQVAQPSRTVHPLLVVLRDLYPQVFGDRVVPLKLGIFHELVAAHPETLEAKALREALGQHTRSTRYLDRVACGVPRHGLDGQAVEEMAPEHVHQAIMEVARRDRNSRSPASQAKLRLRLRNAFEASGLNRGDYAERVKPPLEAWNALLDEAYTEHGAEAAKREALLKAFEGSGQTLAQFADSYGMDVQTTEKSLELAGQERVNKQGN